MAALEFAVAPVFRPLLAPARYKAAHGGRGSGKSHFFADLMVARALRQPGFRGLCGREVQKSLRESAKRLIEQKIAAQGLTDRFKVQADRIGTPGGGAIVFVGLAEHGAESIKSYEGFDVAWVEEAQSVSARSLALLRPTIRAPGSELWFSWNPRRRDDPVDALLRGAEVPTGAAVVRANWHDNPWFPAELDQERRDTLRMHPDHYAHIWDGDHVSVAEGAYFARDLIAARDEARIGRVAFDPLLTVRLFWDIGGTGARADACAIWPAQFVGREIRVRDYYEAAGQPLAAHLNWLRARGYTPDRAQIWLPHDGATNDRVFDVSYESALRDAGYVGTAALNGQIRQASNGYGTSTTTSTPSLLDGIGSAVQIAGNVKSLSDRRAKTNIVKVGELEDGLGVYQYHYIFGGPLQAGVMADEVARLRPWALGGEVGGYQTVCYGAL